MIPLTSKLNWLYPKYCFSSNCFSINASFVDLFPHLIGLNHSYAPPILWLSFCSLFITFNTDLSQNKLISYVPYPTLNSTISLVLVVTLYRLSMRSPMIQIILFSSHNNQIRSLSRTEIFLSIKKSLNFFFCDIPSG